MQALAGRILAHVTALPEGSAVSAKELLHFGSRAAVDQALSRLTRNKQLIRTSHGLYVAPIKTRFGERAPSTQSFISAFIKLSGETVVPSGAAAANSLGLTTQVPIKAIYLTSGKNRVVRLGAQTVELRHAPSWQLLMPTSQAGMAIRALAWMGKGHTHEAIQLLRQTLPKKELERIVSSRSRLPTWLAQEVSGFALSA